MRYLLDSDRILKWWGLNTNYRSREKSHPKEPGQGDLVGQALSWLITNCGSPQSVDIALQTIAGVADNSSRQPLLSCDATLEILQRFASSNLYQGSSAQASRTASLYAKALKFLGAEANPDQGNAAQEQDVPLQGLIWNLHSQAEKSIAKIIVGGQFEPTESNLEALRIGSTAASTCVKSSNRNAQTAAFGSIRRLLHLYSSGQQTLHEAALLSLINATGLLHLFATPPFEAPSIYPICVRLLESHRRASTDHSLLVLSLAITIGLWGKAPVDLVQLERNSRIWREGAIRRLINIHSQSNVGREMILAFGLREIIVGQGPPQDEDRMPEYALRYAADRVKTFYRAFHMPLPLLFGGGNHPGMAQEPQIVPYLEALQNIRKLLPIEPAWCIPFFALGTLCDIQRLGPDPSIGNYNKKLLLSCRFPKLSGLLVWVLQQREGFITRLREIENNDNKGWFVRFTATSQLWLLFTLSLDPSNDTLAERNALREALRPPDVEGAQSETERHGQLGERLKGLWKGIPWYTVEAERIWPTRVMECVYQSKLEPQGREVAQKVQKYLRDVPEEARGLASFTNWRPGMGDNANQGAEAEAQAPGAQATTASVDAIHAQPGPSRGGPLPAIQATEGKGKGKAKSEGEGAAVEAGWSTRTGDGEGTSRGDGAGNYGSGAADEQVASGPSTMFHTPMSIQTGDQTHVPADAGQGVRREPEVKVHVREDGSLSV